LESSTLQVVTGLLFEQGWSCSENWDREQRTVVGKYLFVNRAFKNWNQQPAEALGTFPCKPNFLERELGKQL
jgi:hypothetical protein